MKLITTLMVLWLFSLPFWAQSQSSDITLQLVRSDTDTETGALTNGATLNQGDFPGNTFSIRAVAESLNPGSVQLIYDGNASPFENISPYALFGDSNGNYNGESLSLGSHMITAKAFSGINGSGTLLGETTVQFSVVKDDTPPPNGDEVILSLIHVPSNTIIAQLEDNYTLDLSQFPSNSFNIIANNLQGSQSVQFKLNNSIKTENVVPYALFGDVNGKLNAQSLNVGSYQLEVTVYSADNASGNAIGKKQLSFNVSNSSTPPPSSDKINFSLIEDVRHNLYSVSDGDIFNLANFPDLAETKFYLKTNMPDGVDSMQLIFNGSSRTENTIPYTFFGDYDGKFNVRTLPPGSYTLTAKAYSKSNLQGNLVAEKTITFSTILNIPPTPVALSARVAYAPDNSTVTIPVTAPSGSTFTLSDFTENLFNIEVIPSGSVGSIETELVLRKNVFSNGVSVAKSIQNTTPYFLFGDNNGQPIGEALEPGIYDIKATAYTDANGTGEIVGETVSTPLTFLVFNETSHPRLYLVDATTGERLTEVPTGFGFTLDLSQFSSGSYYFELDKGEDPITNVSVELHSPLGYGPVQHKDGEGNILPFPFVDGHYMAYGGYLINEPIDILWDFDIINSPEYPEAQSEIYLMIRSLFGEHIQVGQPIEAAQTVNLSQYFDPNTNAEGEYIIRAELQNGSDLLLTFSKSFSQGLFENAPYDFFSDRPDTYFNQNSNPYYLATYKAENGKRILTGFSLLGFTAEYSQEYDIETFLFDTDQQQNIGLLEDNDLVGFRFPIDFSSTPNQTVVVNPKVAVGSVVFKINGNTVQVENEAPYSLTGKDNGDLLPFTPPSTTFELMIETWSGADGTGTLLQRYVRSIEVSGFEANSINSTILQVFPNPSNGNIQITTPQSASGQVEIRSLMGEKIIILPSGEQELNLPSGVYLLNYHSDTQQSTQKFIIR
ncbi:T9SS type A sorting domain-containing protein [Limibacter armeniacum]|uniref:T9SS type A sorting domain-containing protein n=1 Tax=Limibacter armeniacum TaxID=466084 RepID=UPI002FE658EA